jgi:hypothetical protein
MLSAKKSGIIVNKNALHLKLNTAYNFSLSALAGQCTITAIINGSCINPSTNTRTQCFDNKQIVFNPQNTWMKKNIAFTLTNDAYASGNYIRGASLVIIADCPATLTAPVLIDDVSVRDNAYTQDAVHYDVHPSVDANAGCCPSSWCWDGKTCVASTALEDARDAPIWNRIFDNYNWTFDHVNTSSQYLARGYRCVLDRTTGIASWTASNIQYDWNYAASGYCPLQTDCFVSKIYGCIRNGDSVNDPSSSRNAGDSGNHYCSNGKWTTKSYLVAQALQNISGGANFIIFCDNATNALNKDAKQYIASACTLTFGDRVVSGIILNSRNKSTEFLKFLKSSYASTFNVNTTGIITNITSCLQESGIFVKCADEKNLFVYYNNRTDYFLISNKRISQIDPAWWDYIVNFFRRLFGRNPSGYDAIKYVSNYDRLYILKNDPVNAQGFEEAKYDEDSMRMLTFLYLNYSGASPSQNKINLNYIKNTIKPLGVYNITKSDGQEIIVKTNRSTGLWEYMTGMLRDR